MYKVIVRPQHEREDIVNQGLANRKETIDFFEYQNDKTKLHVIRVSIDIPIYRMANYRTRIEQLKYVRDNNKHSEFFINGQENESAQQAQHNILVEFSKQGRATSVSPIYDELQKEEQREPLLITNGGLVVNGNRRLAAMRELFVEDGATYRGFGYVNCAVLPAQVSEDDIREIEVRLQMRPETKLPYGWVNEALAIKELLDSNKTSAYIGELMKKRKKDVERTARALTEAEIYLKDWLGAPYEYQRVENAQQFFNDLAEALENKQGENLEVSRRIAWALIANADMLNRRIYDYNFSFGGRADEVMRHVAKRLEVDLIKRGNNEYNDLEVDFGEYNTSESSFEPIIEVFDNSEKRVKATDELITVCNSFLEQDKQGEVGRSALNAVRTANSKLHDVDLSTADPSTYNAINTQLETILVRANKLKDDLRAYLKTN